MAVRLTGWRELSRIVDRGSVVVEVLDARNPARTRSKKLEGIVEKKGKELLLVLNKADLVPRSVAEEWKRAFSLEGLRSVYVSAKRRMGTRMLRREVKKVAPGSGRVVAVVVGFPKTGKSSVINALKGRHSAPTSPLPGSPGYTRGVQLVKIEPGLYLLDTPGLIPVEGGPLESVIRGAPPEMISNPIEPAAELIREALRHNPRAVLDAYGIRDTDPYVILEEIARSRGWLYKKDKEPIVEEAARAVIRDYHEGRLHYYVRPVDAGL